MRKTKKVLKRRFHKLITVCTGLQAQCNATGVTQNSRPPGVGLKLRVGGTKKRVTQYQKQRAGAGQITDTNLIDKILAKVNSDTVLIGNITTALQRKEKPSVTALQQAYTSVANGSRLFDLIYAGQALTKYDTATQPSLIWDHGINNPESITAGKPGTHIYIYEDNTTGLFKLLGVIYKL